MIQLFHIPNHKIDTSNFSHSLHDKSVEELEKKIADYVGAKYACAVNSATNAIFLIMRDKRQNSRSRMVVDLPSMIPPVVASAILTSGFHNEINFTDDILCTYYFKRSEKNHIPSAKLFINKGIAINEVIIASIMPSGISLPSFNKRAGLVIR